LLKQFLYHSPEDVVRLLPEQEEFDPNRSDANDETPVGWAAIKNDETPVGWAAIKNHEGVVKLLLEQEDVDLNRPDERAEHYSDVLLSRDM